MTKYRRKGLEEGIQKNIVRALDIECACSNCGYINRVHENISEPQYICQICRQQSIFNPFKYLVFDCESVIDKNHDFPEWGNPEHFRLKQIAWQLCDGRGRVLEVGNFYIVHDNPEQKTSLHTGEILDKFWQILKSPTTRLVGHNIKVWDIPLLNKEAKLADKNYRFDTFPNFDTLVFSKFFAKESQSDSPDERRTLGALYEKLFHKQFRNPSPKDARIDVEATKKCFFELFNQGFIQFDVDYERLEHTKIFHHQQQCEYFEKTRQQSKKHFGRAIKSLDSKKGLGYLSKVVWIGMALVVAYFSFNLFLNHLFNQTKTQEKIASGIQIDDKVYVNSAVNMRKCASRKCSVIKVLPKNVAAVVKASPDKQDKQRFLYKNWVFVETTGYCPRQKQYSGRCMGWVDRNFLRK